MKAFKDLLENQYGLFYVFVFEDLIKRRPFYDKVHPKNTMVLHRALGEFLQGAGAYLPTKHRSFFQDFQKEIFENSDRSEWKELESQL